MKKGEEENSKDKYGKIQKRHGKGKGKQRKGKENQENKNGCGK